MELKSHIFNGYEVPKNPHDKTTYFNINDYSELDVINSIFRYEKLRLTTGSSSDNETVYYLHISGIGIPSYKFCEGCKAGAKLIWGTWLSKEEHEAKTYPEHDFLGFITRMNGNGGISISVNLNPEKAKVPSASK